MKRIARSFVLVLTTISLVAGIAPDGAVAHDEPSAAHRLFGKAVTDRGTLRIDAVQGPAESEGTAWFTPTAGRPVTITIDCLHLDFQAEITGYGPFVYPIYSHTIYAAGKSSNGRRYYMTLPAYGENTPVVLQPFVTTKPSSTAMRWQRRPCGARWPMSDPVWQEGAILLLLG